MRQKLQTEKLIAWEIELLKKWKEKIKIDCPFNKSFLINSRKVLTP